MAIAVDRCNQPLIVWGEYARIDVSASSDEGNHVNRDEPIDDNDISIVMYRMHASLMR